MMPFITTDDGVRLHYLEHGNPAGPAVVLIAGFKAAATSWRYQHQPFAKAGYRVLSFDRRGHGASDRPEHGASMAQHGDDLARFLDEVKLANVVLVGGSMGGNTIWSHFARHGSDRVRAAVIVDQTPKMLNSDDWAYGFYDYDESNRDSYFATGVPDPGRHDVKSKGLLRIARLLRTLDRREPRQYTPAELALLNDHAKADWRDTIAETDVPALFVAGRESELWPAEHAAAAAALGWQGESVVLDDAGHAANIEQPRRFNDAVLEFLARLG